MLFYVHDPNVHDPTEWASVEASTRDHAVVAYMNGTALDPREMPPPFPILVREPESEWECVTVQWVREGDDNQAVFLWEVGARWGGCRVPRPEVAS